jgi:RNA-directed DNA polymerase
MNIDELAVLLKLSDDELTKLAGAASRLYRQRTEPKKRGGYRLIEAPYPNLKQIQKQVLRRVLDGMASHKMLYGGKGTSPKLAVKPHVMKPLVMTMDIKDFFPSVKAFMVRRMFLAHMMNGDVSNLLTRLVTRKNRLPQGAPMSPSVARLVLAPLCEELDGLLRSVHPNAAASIYVDDLTISGPIGLKRIEKTVVSIFQRHGFSIKLEKTKKMGREEEQISLGICLNDGIEATKKYRDEVSSLAKEVPPADPKLKGKIAYLNFLKKK